VNNWKGQKILIDGGMKQCQPIVRYGSDARDNEFLKFLIKINIKILLVSFEK
jgi:hypothetical protein